MSASRPTTRRRLHVCFVNNSFGKNSIGGVMNHMVGLAHALRSQDVTVSVICPAWTHPWRYMHDGVIDVTGIEESPSDWKVPLAPVGFGLRCGPALLERHREKPIDLIHLHDRPPILGAGWASRRLGIPVVYTAHSCLHSGAEEWPGVDARISRWLERRIARSGTPVITGSEWTRRAMIAIGADPHRTVVIPNGVDLDAFLYRGQEGRNPGELLFVGRFDREKGFDVLLRAFRRIAPTTPVTLTAVGVGDLGDRDRQLARELGIAERVQFVGRLFGVDLVTAYQRASVCILPSRSESFGMVMLEAMACGAPFVGTAVGGVAEVTEHERTGLLVPPDDPAAMAAAITRLLDDRALGRRLAESARRMVEQQYSWDGVAEQTREFYDRALAHES